MNRVNVRLTELRLLGNGKCRAFMAVGDLKAEAVLTFEALDDAVVGFNFDEENLFSFVLHYCGLGKQFNEDVGRLCNGDTLTFPLDYGDIDDACVSRAIARSGKEEEEGKK